MKRYLIFIFWLLCLSSQAQVNQAQIDAIIPKEKVKTGILYNRVMPFAGLQTFGQNGRKDTSHYEHFIQAYYELYQASYNNKEMLRLEQIRNWIRYKSERNMLLLGLIHYNFNYSEDLSLDKISQEGFTPPHSNNLKIRDLTTFVVAPLSKTPLQAGKPITVELHEKLIFSNTTSSIVYIQRELQD